MRYRSHVLLALRVTGDVHAARNGTGAIVHREVRRAVRRRARRATNRVLRGFGL